MVVWTVIYAWYSILPFAHPDPRDPVGGMGHGLMSADQPWSGAIARPCSSLACPGLLCRTLPRILHCTATLPAGLLCCIALRALLHHAIKTIMI
eukprot:COSAG06_NODE_854_length_11931_cov_55.985970_14_plen_94_part_00